MEKLVFNTYGELIKYKREYLCFSKSDFAMKLHLSLNELEDIENDDEEIPFDIIGLLCKKLKIDLDSFLEKKNNMNNDLCEKYKFNVDKFTLFLRMMRNEKDITQLKVSKELKISNIRLSRIENGTLLPTIQEFFAFCSFYNVNKNYLYFGLNQNEIEMIEKAKESNENEPFYKNNKFLVLVTIIISFAIIFSILIPFFLKHNSQIEGGEKGDKGDSGDGKDGSICQRIENSLLSDDLLTF